MEQVQSTQPSSIENELKAPQKPAASWVADFEKRSLEELRNLLWSFEPGTIARTERPDLRKFDFPSQVNVISLGPASTGKSSYINGLMSIINPSTEVLQIHSEHGTESTTGTVRLEGPFCLNDWRKKEVRRTVVQLWTTMGVPSYVLDQPELLSNFVTVIKKCFLGQIKPGEYTGLLGAGTFNPLLKRTEADESLVPKYDVAIITAKYGNRPDAEHATRLYNILSKQNNIPTLVLVTHAGENNSWDLMKNIEKSNVFYVENYTPGETLEAEKSKRLLIPLLEAIKRAERSDAYWSNARESISDVLARRREEWSRSFKLLNGSTVSGFLILLFVLIAIVVGYRFM